MNDRPKPMTLHRQDKKPFRRDVLIAACCGALAAGMVGASFAAIPFYNWFCRTTGFAGTTQVSRVAPQHMLARTLTIRFDSNVTPGLPWKFVPEQNEIKLHIGEVATVHYKVINEAARTITAQASYNVSPPTVGAYFNKINCFCFTQQTMKPGETREMTVVFYVDPSIVKDPDQDVLNTITLSYTFYRLREPSRPVAEAPNGNSSKL
jgi:cytochrome c oxidase assembly protein subunit 11